MRWMRRRGDRVTTITGKYAGQPGTIESNVYQKTVEYPHEFANGYHVMLDTEELVTVRWDQVEAVKLLIFSVRIHGKIRTQHYPK